MKIDPRKTAVLVIDMQFDFYAAGGKAEQKGRQVASMQALPDKINAFTNEMRRRGSKVIFSKFIDDPDKNPDNYREIIEADTTDGLCEVNTPGVELHGVSPKPSDELIEKYTYDCFAGTKLKQILEKQQAENVVVTGVRTEVCIVATANRSFTEGYRTFVISDLIGTYDNKQDISDAILESLKYSSFVWTSSKFLKQLA